VRAEASLTSIAVQRAADAAATATVVARVDEPKTALERALGRLFGAFQEPTGRSYDQLSDIFAPAALQGLRAEADYLRGSGRHLGGASTFTVNASPPEQLAPDRAQIHTIERWLYDERDDADRRQRCFIEDSDQNYVMLLNGQFWMVDEFHVGGTKRSECPPGT
jgi:hypothetical protein